MAVATANTPGHTKKITTNAFLLMGYCVGNFISPFFFLTSQVPTYNLPLGMMFFCIAIQVLSIAGIGLLLWWRNKKRAGVQETGSEAYEKGFLDLTDLENEHFKVSYINFFDMVCILLMLCSVYTRCGERLPNGHELKRGLFLCVRSS